MSLFCVIFSLFRHRENSLIYIIAPKGFFVKQQHISKLVQRSLVQVVTLHMMFWGLRGNNKYDVKSAFSFDG